VEKNFTLNILHKAYSTPFNIRPTAKKYDISPKAI
jgi:hypothetical protein